MENRKICNTCGKEKPASDFPSRKVKGKQYLQPYCRDCHNTKRRERRKERRPDNRPITAAERQALRDKVREIKTNSYSAFEKTYYTRKRKKSNSLDYIMRYVEVVANG